MLAKPRSLKGDDEPSYLMRALHNTFFSSRRSASRRPVTGATLEQVQVPDPRASELSEHTLQTHEIYEAIATLPDNLRLALVAVDVLGLSYREAGRGAEDARGDDHHAGLPRPRGGRPAAQSGRPRRRRRAAGHDDWGRITPTAAS